MMLKSQSRADEFLNKLTDLSKEYGIWITEPRIGTYLKDDYDWKLGIELDSSYERYEYLVTQDVDGEAVILIMPVNCK